MVRRSQHLRLRDNVHEIDAVTRLVQATDHAGFVGDWTMRSAAERAIERISEASGHLDADLKAQHADIPWPRVADIGNWLRHAYEQADPSLIWFVIADDLPRLRSATVTMIEQTPLD